MAKEPRDGETLDAMVFTDLGEPTPQLMVQMPDGSLLRFEDLPTDEEDEQYLEELDNE